MKELLIKTDNEETAVALLENGILMEIYFERSRDRHLLGGIYKGMVQNVLPGMQAAFVDIGLAKNAFLYVEDILPASSGERGVHKINELVKVGQELLLQIIKEPVGSKGACVTANPSLPGRFLVLLPGGNYLAVSRRINDEEEVKRLKELVGEFLPAGMGAIIRTAAAGVSRDEVALEVKNLVKQWKRIQGKAAAAGAPALIHRDLDLVQRIIRDININEEIKIIADSAETRERILELIPESLSGLPVETFYGARDDFFSEHMVEPQLAQALYRKVWLKSGGYLIIDQMEALTVIDVNTGKFVGSHDLAETVLKTNLEAVTEIARQLRLRNLGGIIIVDFIDMDNAADKERLLTALIEETQKDHTRVIVLGITQLGLVEMTRKKIGQELSRSLETECPFCHGKGRVLSEESVAIQIRREIGKVAEETCAPTVYVAAHPAVAAYLIGPYARNLQALKKRLGKVIQVKGAPEMLMSEFIVRPSEGVGECGAVAPVTVGQYLTVRIEEQHQDRKEDGIVRINGFVVDVVGGGTYLGKEITVRIEKVLPSSAKAVIAEKSA